MRWLRTFLLGLSLSLAAAATTAQPAPVATPAIDGVLAAFKAHPLVGINDMHGATGSLAQEADFYAALMRDQRFATEVGHVVVEFGGAIAQPVLDRYLNGETVPYAELRKVWTDGVGAVPIPSGLGYMNFFAQVRQVNLALPPDRRIRVWLGDPPLDWSRATAADLMTAMRQRDTYPAALIEREILAKNRKALVIYGGLHLVPGGGLRVAVERNHPGAFFLVSPYTGYVEKACSEAFEREIASAWPTPALVTPLRGGALAQQMQRTGCHFAEQGTLILRAPPGASEEQQRQVAAAAHAIAERGVSGADSDALLYLGPAASLTASPVHPDLYLDEGLRTELARRQALRSVPGLPPMTLSPIDMERYRAGPRRWRRY